MMIGEPHSPAGDEWFYEDGGRSRGPVTRAQLVELVAHKFIPEATQIWNVAFGQQWRAADETDLVPRRSSPPPLPPRPPNAPPVVSTSPASTGNEAPLRDAQLWGRQLASPDRNAPASPAAGKAGLLDQPAAIAVAPSLPEPASGCTPDNEVGGRGNAADPHAPERPRTLAEEIMSRVSPVAPAPVQKPRPVNTFAYLLAFSPLLFAFIEILLASRGIDPNGSSTVARGISYWTAIGTVVVAVVDAGRVKKGGLNPDARTLAPFILLTPIGYFIRRNAIVPGSLRFLWMWLGSAFVFVCVALALVNPDA